MKFSLASLGSESPLWGIAINDKEIAIANTKGLDTLAIECVRVDLPKGVVNNGKIVDQLTLIQKLEELFMKMPERAHRANLSVPTSLTFSALFCLPQTIEDGPKAAIAANLLIPTILPWPPSDSVFDFTVRTTDGEEPRTVVSLVAMKRTDVEAYTSALLSVGITPVTLETDSSSETRLLTTDSDTHSITLTTGETHAYISSMFEGRIEYVFSYPLTRTKDMATIESEIERVRLYVENETGESMSNSPSHNVYREDIIDRLPRGADSPACYAATGAAILGVERRTSVDKTNTSLLPLPAENILGLEKLLDTLKFSRAILTIVIALYILANTIAFITFRASETSIIISSPDANMLTAVSRMESDFNASNDSIQELAGIARSMTRWSEPLTMIASAFTPGITPLSISSNGNLGPYQVTGVADTRGAFNQFRNILTVNPSIRAPRVPLVGANLETKIPFSATLFVNSATTTP